MQRSIIRLGNEVFIFMLLVFGGTSNEVAAMSSVQADAQATVVSVLEVSENLSGISGAPAGESSSFSF